jgi:glycosyltransferase involved in cell wall biosynthesis
VTTLRVGINLLWLLPDSAGGAEEYAVRVLRALEIDSTPEVHVTVLCNRRFPRAHPDLFARFPTAVAPIDGRSRPLRIAVESSWLAREGARRGLNLIHHMNNVVPWVRNRPSVLTIHDLRPLAQPDTLGGAHGAYLRSRLHPSVRHAAAVTTPSEFVRETVIEMLDADPARVLVVSAPVLLQDDFEDDPEADVGGENGGTPSFVYPAITTRHKNHRVLLEAFARLVAARNDVHLILTGASGPAEGEVRAAIARLGLDERVDRLGRVPAARLRRLLRGASALVYPSRYEGYGLPISEAMALGCPVIASGVTALPEVVGDAGLLIDPDDVDGWANAMQRLLVDADLRARLIAAGRERVRSLTPAETARRSMKAFRLAAGGA